MSKIENIKFEIKTNPITSRTASRLSPVPHFHQELEMVFVESGSVQAFADKKCYSLSSGDLFLTFPNQVHFYKNCTVGKYHFLIFSHSTLFGIKNIIFDNVLRSSALNGDVLLALKEPINHLQETFSDNANPFNQTVQVGILNQIMATILKDCGLKSRMKSDNETLIKIFNFCEQNLQDVLTLEFLANSLHLNKYYISHLLKKKIGIGFNAYINSLRIKNACDLLVDTDKKASDISEEVGFGSIRSFNRAFLETMNTTPTKYRNQIKNKNKVLHT